MGKILREVNKKLRAYLNFSRKNFLQVFFSELKLNFKDIVDTTSKKFNKNVAKKNENKLLNKT